MDILLDFFRNQICGQIIAGAMLLVAVVTFVITSLQTRRVRKQEIYQRLELASIDLFRFEVEQHDKAWRLYDEKFVELKLANMPESEQAQAEWEITNHATQLLNLFEMSIELHNSKIVDDKIFCTWLKWIFETAELPTFRYLWEKRDLKKHYTGNLGELINYSIVIAGNGNFDTFMESLCKNRLQCKSKSLRTTKKKTCLCLLEDYLDKCNKANCEQHV